MEGRAGSTLAMRQRGVDAGDKKEERWEEVMLVDLGILESQSTEPRKNLNSQCRGAR